ncbi:MAG: hypothetical protein F4Y41_21080 [Gammaproteobacteria bacterium]|nr:hypothetical protein [Gammaproteobacteria bacterium]MYF30284.1 hypothetical protein [Gammaproteobacteria bacterium]
MTTLSPIAGLAASSSSYPIWNIVEVAVSTVVGGLMVAATWFLYSATKQLAAAASKAEDRERQRDEPRVTIGAIRGSPESGFFVTNEGIPDVTIIEVCFGLGIPVDEEGLRGSFTESTPKVIRRDNVEVALPQRLRHGDTISVLYEAAQLIARSSETRLQPVARDSLGNNYVGLWLEYRTTGGSTYEHPGEGLRPPDIL